MKSKKKLLYGVGHDRQRELAPIFYVGVLTHFLLLSL
jgi:hypothetical protein